MFLDSVIYLKNPAQYERDLHKAPNQTGKLEPFAISISRQTFKRSCQLMHEREIAVCGTVLDAQGQVIGIPDPW